MMLLSLLLETQKAVICHGGWISRWRCGVQRKVNEINSVCVANESRVFVVCPLFYGDPVHILQKISSFLVLRSQTRLFLMCGFMFWWSYLEKAWCFFVIKINAGLLSVLKFCLFVQGIQVLIMCYCTLQLFQTSRDASKDHYHAFPWQNRPCCVEVGNVR
jgi:hypothetical protein